MNSTAISTSAETVQQQEGQTSAPGLSLAEFERFFLEVQNQPAWRLKADREMDYVDGNQLDAEILRKMTAVGMPPAIEPLIGPAVDAVMGFEAKTRKDYRVVADTPGPEGDLVAKAINYKVNQAERHSGADRAMSDAFKPQYCVGLGWVEVSRESDPFKYPYRCKEVHRNEIFWDWLAKEPDLSDARYLIRRRWTDLHLAKLKFPNKAALIQTAGRSGWADGFELTVDGGGSTNLFQSALDERGWSIEEMEWRDSENQRVCLFEVWYRRWETVTFLKTPDGRVVEFDPTNRLHNVYVAAGIVKPQKAIVARMYCSFWMGPHKLHDGPTPYKHCNFPYVPFWGKREDRTRVPFGAVRAMVFLQDNVNSGISKLRWGMASVRTIRTKGAYTGSDEILRQQIARVDADIVLSAEEMAKPGARFEVERDFELNEQHFQMLQMSREGIARASGITNAFEGLKGTARSGVQESTQIEQTTQSLADVMDNFSFARTKVGELLMALIIEDSIGVQETVKIPSNGVTPEAAIPLNAPAMDPATGQELGYCSNDVERTMLKVALNDVPTTSSFRAQQLQAMAEAFKSMPQDIQVVALPHMLNLMDVPDKDEIIKAIQDSRQNLTEEQVQQRIDQALKNAQYDLKNRELALKYSPEKLAKELEAMDANIRNLDAKARQTLAMMVKAYIEATFGAVQAAEVITAVPQVAGPADIVIANAGGLPGASDTLPSMPGQGTLAIEPVKNRKSGVDFTPGAAAVPANGQPGGPAAGDTSPQTTAGPQSPFVGENRGIHTMPADSAGPTK